MTFEKYKEWLDDQIDDNDRRMEESDDEMGSYYLGCATAFTVAKEKFIAINLVSPSPAPTVEGRELSPEAKMCVDMSARSMNEILSRKSTPPTEAAKIDNLQINNKNERQ